MTTGHETDFVVNQETIIKTAEWRAASIREVAQALTHLKLSYAGNIAQIPQIEAICDMFHKWAKDRAIKWDNVADDARIAIANEIARRKVEQTNG